MGLDLCREGIRHIFETTADCLKIGNQEVQVRSLPSTPGFDPRAFEIQMVSASISEISHLVLSIDRCYTPFMEQNIKTARKDVHTEHCCLYSCKYGDKDCTVVTGLALPSYACEYCNCDLFNSEREADFDNWWKSLDQDQKRSLYCRSKRYGQ